MPIFDIPGERLADLTGDGVQELIARLCEAERERQGGHRCNVRWGGSQTAPDGGLDIGVDAGGPVDGTGLLVRQRVGLQVKKHDIAAAGITKEMRPAPSKALRPEISRLAERGGSYIIASAGANLPPVKIRQRVEDMKAALGGDPNRERLHLDFLGRQEIVRWVSAHPSVALWLKEQLHLPILEGWQPFENWSLVPDGQYKGLICEEGLVFEFEDGTRIRDIPSALDKMRSIFRASPDAMRMVGLSGVGKTRLAQALFETIPNEGEQPFPESEAIYVDLGQSHSPSPMRMLETLMERGAIDCEARAFLVVDNCPSDTHRALAGKLATRVGPVRLLTIEHDVCVDRPLETKIVRVWAEGSGIVASLLRRRHPWLAGTDAQRIADLAQGNARLGLALARAAPQSGSLSTFEDEDLFNRLFWQRGERSGKLERAAEVLSLVYQFDVDGEETPDDLEFLGPLAGLSRLEMFRQAGVLLDRELAQARGNWRAVLPHALANRMARRALRLIPARNIADAFADNGRLRRSLARRLSFLHDSKEARRVVGMWLEPEGPLHGGTLARRLSLLGDSNEAHEVMQMWLEPGGSSHGLAPELGVLEAVCHMAPRRALAAVKEMIPIASTRLTQWNSLSLEEQLGDFGIACEGRAVHGGLHMTVSSRCIESLARITERIARTDEMFPAACETLVELAKARGVHFGSSAVQAIDNLFERYQSGTLARTEVRVSIARQFCVADDEGDNILGVRMLTSAFRTANWSSPIGTDDNARSDAYGWAPQGEEINEWYSCWLDLALDIACESSSRTRSAVRTVIADAVGRLWLSLPNLRGQMASLARQLHELEPWAEGWNAFRDLLREAQLGRSRLPDLQLEAIRETIEHLAPSDLASKVRATATMDVIVEAPEEEGEAVRNQHRKYLENLGFELAADPDEIVAVRDVLFGGDDASCLSIGVGLGRGGDAGTKTWPVLRDLFLGSPEENRNTSVLSGFIRAIDETSRPVSAAIRAECRRIPRLRRVYGSLLPQGRLTPEEFAHVVDIARDFDSAADGLAELAWSRERELEVDQRIRLLRAIHEREDGSIPVIDALQAIWMIEEEEGEGLRKSWPTELCEIGIEAVNNLIVSGRMRDEMEVEIICVLQRCLQGGFLGYEERCMDAYIELSRRHAGSITFLDWLPCEIARVFPDLFLRRVFPDGAEEPEIPMLSNYAGNPLMQVPLDLVTAWCREIPARWLMVAKNISPFGSDDYRRSGSSGCDEFALGFLAAAPSPGDIVAIFANSVMPQYYSDGMAIEMERRLRALNALRNPLVPEIGKVLDQVAPEIRGEIAKVSREIADNKTREKEHIRAMLASFE